MSQVEMNAYEAVLRMCASAAPNPWHPQQYSRRSGTPLDQINAVLKDLWDLGLLERAAPHPEFGPGLRLSAKGLQLLNDPAALGRLCAGDSFMSDDGDGRRPRLDGRTDDERSHRLLESLRRPGFSYVNWLLLGANLVVFLFGLYLAYQTGVAMLYLGGVKTLIAASVFLGLFLAFNVTVFSQYINGTTRFIILMGVFFLLMRYDVLLFPVGGAEDAIRHRCGLLTATDWLRGEWWRALTACFVHLGLLHLMANMSMLVNGGWFIERMWGHVRFLVIYLLAGVTGSLAGLAFNPNGLAGASGALCGLVASEAVWVLFNGKYLPRKLQQEWRNNLVLNFSLLAAISFVPGVSLWGHLGGALAGGAAAVCLHYQRFGAPVWRWAALLGLLPIPFGGLYLIDRERHSQKMWAKAEILNFEESYKHHIDTPLTKEMREAFQEKVRPVLVNQPPPREQAKVDAALAVLAEQQKELEAWQAQLKGLGPYGSKSAKEVRQKALDAVTARLDIYERAQRCLREGEKFPANEAEDLKEKIAETPELQTPAERRRVALKKPDETEEERQARQKREREEEAAKGNQKEIDRDARELKDDVAEKLEAAKTLFDRKLASDLERPPDEWIVPTLKKNLAAIEMNRKELQTLGERLPKLGPYKSENHAKALECAKPCAAELEKLLEMTQRRFEAGDKWTNEEKAALKAQIEKCNKAYQAWRTAFEQ